MTISKWVILPGSKPKLMQCDDETVVSDFTKLVKLEYPDFLKDVEVSSLTFHPSLSTSEEESSIPTQLHLHPYLPSSKNEVPPSVTCLQLASNSNNYLPSSTQKTRKFHTSFLNPYLPSMILKEIIGGEYDWSALIISCKFPAFHGPLALFL